MAAKPQKLWVKPQNGQATKLRNVPADADVDDMVALAIDQLHLPIQSAHQVTVWDSNDTIQLSQDKLVSDLLQTNHGDSLETALLLKFSNESKVDPRKPSPQGDEESCNNLHKTAPWCDSYIGNTEARSACTPGNEIWDCPTKKLRVHFMNKMPQNWFFGHENVRIDTDRVIEWANKWNYSGIPKFERAPSIDESDIRVKFNESDERSWSYIGTDAKKHCGEKTMLLYLGSGRDDYTKNTVVHEFGHALGLGHEHQRSCFWKHLRPCVDVTAMKNDLQLTDEKLYDELEDTTSGTGTQYDSKSIMHYWFKVEWLISAYRDKSYVQSLGSPKKEVLLGVHARNWNNCLPDRPSEKDIEFLRSLYGQGTDSREGEGVPCIKTELVHVGLDRSDYWANVFQEELGVTTPIALKHVGSDVYPNLVRFANDAKEKKALRKLLGIKQEYSPLPFKDCRESQIKQLNNRYEEAKKLLKTLKQRLESGERNDKTTKGLEFSICELLQIPTSAWFSEGKALKELIGKVQHIVDQISMLLTQVDYEAGELLQHASNGRALQGILLSKELEEQVKVRAEILMVPQNPQLMFTYHPQNDRIEQFSSEQEEEGFLKTVRLLGYSASKTDGLWEVCTGTRAALKSSMHTSPKQEQEPYMYTSTVKHSSVPLTSFTFSNRDLQLSDSAINDLKEIEGKMGSQRKVNSLCETFLGKYGSHATRGPLHFGGSFTVICSSRLSEIDRSELDALKQLQKDAVTISHDHTLSTKPNSQDSVDITGMKGNYAGRFSEVTVDETGLETKTEGGPPESSTMPEWKAGLIASNRGWSLIDRGTTLVPVWEIVETNYQEHFRNAKELSETLKRVWETMNDLNAQPSDSDVKDFHSLKTHLEKTLASITEGPSTTLDPMLSTPTSKHSDSLITASVARAFNSLLTNLQKSGSKYERLFFATLLYPFQCGTSWQPVILNQLSQSDLYYMKRLLDIKYKQFREFLNEDFMKLQAFLFHLAVYIFLDETQVLDIDTYQVMQHLQYMQAEIGGELQLPVKKILSQCYVALFNDWSQFNEQLHTLTMASVSSKPKKDRKEEIYKLFDLLDIRKHYPQKLSLIHALSIRKEETTPCTDPRRLHTLLLQRIMAYDCRCRETLLCRPSSTPNSFDDDFEDETEHAGIQESIHPMDSLLALIHCADDFLRQDLMARLVDCQLSIPLILPDPFTGQLTFLLWAMRSIIKEWETNDRGTKNVHEYPLISQRAPIISFVRFGKHKKSKSKILNAVISDTEVGHFFHRDCEGGSFARWLGDGLVDVCWYLPAGKSNIFPDIVTFLNLHGNAKDHPRQIAFLSDISFMTFAMITEEDLNEESTKVLQQLSAAPGGVVLCTTSNPSEFKELSENIPGKLTCLKLNHINAHDTKKEIRARINSQLEKVWTKDANALKLEECTEIADKRGLLMDENKKDFLKGQKMAQDLLTMVSQHKDRDCSAKEKMLPLQGEKLWQLWAKRDKEEHRQFYRASNVKFQDYSSLQKREKNKLRKQQLENIRHLSPLMKTFIGSLLETSGNVRNFFLHCLKLELNNLSRCNITAWLRESKTKRSQLHSLEKDIMEINKKLPDQSRSRASKWQKELLDNQKQLEDQIRKVKTEIHTLDKKIISATLGLEHLLRELGQVYEADQELPTHCKQYSGLPKVAAELLIEGYPIELMDGDAAHVPLTWVRAVMEQSVTLLRDPQVYVLSVLGLQSSGKSTLINTTFGLKFQVSAGRCTRGAFMQLLPISDELRHEADCDYVLVVDTEGLRAPELEDQAMKHHDNELAAYAIGLASATMINIMGETPGDMDDILQTAVHAFIRMKQVKLNPSCQFVHQNVPAVGASDKGRIGRAKFKEKLDKMTAAAAKEEKFKRKVEYFSDVIHFDAGKDVHHFPGLWKGDPPMAPVNPGYSEKALNLRSHLIERLTQAKDSIHLSLILLKATDLWMALLHEKFVFSFKNTLELSVYNSLDIKCIEWSRTLRSKMLDWEQKAEREIRNSNPVQLKASERRMFDAIPTRVCELHDEIAKETKKYFEESAQRAMLVQWEVETTNRLQRLAKELENHAVDHCRELISSQKALETAKNRKAHYIEQMMGKVKELVEYMHKQDRLLEVVDEKLREVFDKQWSGWICEFKKDVPLHRQEVDIGLYIQNSLIETYKSEEHSWRKKLEKRPLSQWGEVLYIEVRKEHYEYTTTVTVEQPQQQSLLTRILAWRPGQTQVQSVEVQCIAHAKKVSKNVFDKVENFLSALRTKNFHPSYPTQLITIIKRAWPIDGGCQTGRVDMNLTKEFYIDVTLTACGFAARHFENMRERFLKEHDPIEYLEREMKTTLFTMFKNKYNQVASEKQAACAFCEVLTNSIRREVLDSLSPKIFEDMKALPHLVNKSALKARILIDLGEDLKKTGDLNPYFLHLTDVAESHKKWLKRYTEQHCKVKRRFIGRSTLVALAQQKLVEIVQAVREQVDQVTDVSKCENGIDTDKWQTSLKSGSLKSVVDLSVFDGFNLKEHGKVKDVQYFTEEIHKGLEALEKKLKKEFQQLTLDSEELNNGKTMPYGLLYELLCGCTEQCPFCGEQCDCTDNEHEVKHSVQEHRPECLATYRYIATQEMVTNVCNSSVGSDGTFRNKDTNGEFFPYKRFQELYPKWGIPVDMSADSSLYWKWFVGNYSKQLAEQFNAKDNDIPADWKEYTWEEAKREVKQAYRV